MFLFYFFKLKVLKIYLKVFVSIHYHFLEYRRRIWDDGAKNGTVPTSRRTTANMSTTESNNQNTIHYLEQLGFFFLKHRVHVFLTDYCIYNTPDQL